LPSELVVKVVLSLVSSCKVTAPSEPATVICVPDWLVILPSVPIAARSTMSLVSAKPEIVTGSVPEVLATFRVSLPPMPNSTSWKLVSPRPL
jgi:hypothetical protein